jgi:hypothetical protein
VIDAGRGGSEEKRVEIVERDEWMNARWRLRRKVIEGSI